MKSNYKKIGDYIWPVNKRNKDLQVTDLLGINIDKFFMPSVANIVGTDLSVYKVVSKNQFACNRMHVWRDHRIPIALSRNEVDFIVSPAYDVFEIKDETLLLPEYLMMWLSRAEFDRNAWFYTDADVRGAISWDAFCNLPIPIPDITKQQEIINEYNVIKNRITLNETLIMKLEDTAQALYRQWFVDYEFPDADGKPYKSNGGEMEYSWTLEKEVPRGWELQRLSNFCNFQNWYSYTSEELKESKIWMVTIKNFDKNWWYKIEWLKEIIPQKNYKDKTIEIWDVLVAHTDLTQWTIIGNPLVILSKSHYELLVFSMDTVKIISKISGINNSLYYFILKQSNFYDFASWYVNWSTVMHLSKNALLEYSILFPNEISIAKKLSMLLNSFMMKKSIIYKEIENLWKMKDLILAKMASVG